MRGLFRACYFFCERMQKKRQLGIRAFFIFERCERNTVLAADTRIVYFRAGLLKLCTTASESDFFCINPPSRIRHSSGNNRFWGGRRSDGPPPVSRTSQQPQNSHRLSTRKFFRGSLKCLRSSFNYLN
jgi:hypothetical protein